MYTIKMLRENYEDLTMALERRGFKFPYGFDLLLMKQKQLQVQVEELRTRKNEDAKRVGDGALPAENKTMFRDLKAARLAAETELTQLEAEIERVLLLIPNILHPNVPDGKNEQDNPVVKIVGDCVVKPKAHWDLLPETGFAQDLGVKLAKARFNVLPPVLAKAQRKLLGQAFDVYEGLGYQEHYVPFLVNQQTMKGTGQYPKFRDELFHAEDLMLIPTGEVPLTNLVADTILDNDFRELKLMTQTPCFRKEVGAAGLDTKGLIRQHQFEKLELVRICHPDLGKQNFFELVADIECFVKTLDIPYRIIELCAGDIGFAGHKAYDFELWFAGQNRYREIATITWCHEFQARRMKTRLKDKRLAHTLNGTGLAAGRVLMAQIEWRQKI